MAAARESPGRREAELAAENAQLRRDLDEARLDAARAAAEVIEATARQARELAARIADLAAAAAELEASRAALAAGEARLRLALDAAGMGAWSWHQGRDAWSWDARTQAILGWRVVDGGASVSLQAFRAIVHPGDRRHLDAAVARALATGGLYEAEFRIRRPSDGAERWVRSRARPERDPEGDSGGLVWRGVVADVTERRAAEAALREGEERFRALVESIPANLWVSRPDGEVAYRNSHWLRYAGLPDGDDFDWRTIIHPEDRARHLAERDAAFREGRSAEITSRLRRADGAWRWHVTRIVPMRVGGRVAAFLGVSTDVDDLHRAVEALHEGERRRTLLVAELNHRVKNTLATVQALAAHTLRGAHGDLSRFAHDFGARLQALALAHDLLTGLSWGKADLAAVTRAALAPWLGDGGRIALGGSDGIMLAPRQAQALVLALHELATNALKHGALSRAGGRVAVRWSRAPPDGPAEVAWTERGGPRVPGPPARRGFGTRLLERGLARDLGPGATVELRFASTGLRAIVRFAPAAGGGGRDSWLPGSGATGGGPTDPR